MLGKIWNMKLAVVIMCVVTLARADQETPVVLCGRELANARVLVCYGAEYVSKRASPQSIAAALASGDKWVEELMWGGRRGALSADWNRYKRGGLADECCLKPCTTADILNYC